MNRITLEPGKRGGRPCIRGLRISVYDVLSMLSSGMTHEEIVQDFPELEAEDILAVLAFAADREHKVLTAVSQSTGRDIADIVRGLIEQFSEAEIHRARSVTAILRVSEGAVRNRASGQWEAVPMCMMNESRWS